MTPTLAAEAVRAGLVASPSGRAGIVSKPENNVSPLSVFLGHAKTYSRLAGQTVMDIFGPSDINVPGTAPLANALGKGAMKVGNETARGIQSVAKATSETISSAGEGVKSGFKTGVLILVLIVGIWVWAQVRPR